MICTSLTEAHTEQSEIPEKGYKKDDRLNTNFNLNPRKMSWKHFAPFLFLVQLVQFVSPATINDFYTAENIKKNAGMAQAQARAGPLVDVVEDFVETLIPGDPKSGLWYRIGIPKGGTTGTEGVNILLHGDGASSYISFPNAPLKDNLIGVALLAPHKLSKWGGGKCGNECDLERSEAQQHSVLIDAFITNELPKLVKFDPSKVYFTGASGGSLLLSNDFIPRFAEKYNAGYMLLCGGMGSKDIAKQDKMASVSRIHFQTSAQDLDYLRDPLTKTVQAVAASALKANMSPLRINQRFTIDRTPPGGHCGFDSLGLEKIDPELGQDEFDAGVQLMIDNFSNIMFKRKDIPSVTAMTSVLNDAPLVL